MSVFPRLRELLDRQGATYALLAQPAPPAAQASAGAMRPLGREMAKVVVVAHGGEHSLTVVPANARVDLPRLSATLRTPVTLAGEREIVAAFPDCELEAVPPFGVLYGVKTYLDESFTHDRHITFHAGSRTEAIRMPFEDYRRVAAPVVLWLAESLASAEG